MLDYRVYTFLEAFRRHSYTDAAQALRITQPAVSQHIRQLEQHYGCQLFCKSGRTIMPTPAGEALYRELSTAVNDETRSRAELQSLQSELGSHAALQFGCTRTVADYAAPHWLAHHLNAHPHDHLRLVSGNTRELLEALELGDIDFAIVEGPFDRDLYDSVPFSLERYVAVAAPHALDTPVTSIHDLLGYRLILREQGSGTREILERNLAAQELSIKDFKGVVELGSIPAIKACVKAGAGVSFLYRAAVERELAEQDLCELPLRDFMLHHEFRLIWQHKSKHARRWQAIAASWRATLDAKRQV